MHEVPCIPVFHALNCDLKLWHIPGTMREYMENVVSLHPWDNCKNVENSLPMVKHSLKPDNLCQVWLYVILRDEGVAVCEKQFIEVFLP